MVEQVESQVLISVLIPTYNCAQYISEAIDSILAQDYDNLEIIVVDDGSTDNTKEIVTAYCSGVACNAFTRNASTVKYFYKENGGISSARNYCLKKASGEYIAWCDSDDYWLPGKLRAQMEYFEEHPDCEIVFTGYKNFIENEEIKYQANVQKELDLEQTYKHYLPSALIKKEVFEKCGNFSTDFVVGEDTEMIECIRLFGIDTSNFIEKCLYIRRLHGSNITLLSGNIDYSQLYAQIYLSYLKRNVRLIHLKNKRARA
jgi:glycosyltransferase involved in cell wall biosynthesis